jgi:hypothetical protein
MSILHNNIGVPCYRLKTPDIYLWGRVLQPCGRKLWAFSPKREHRCLSHHHNLFEEALGFRVSSEHGGGHGTTEEEWDSSPCWHEGHTTLVYEVHQISRTYGGVARLTSPLDTIIRSTTIRSAIFRGVYRHDREGGEEAHSPWVEACSECWLRRPSFPHIGFSYGTPRLGAIL